MLNILFYNLLLNIKDFIYLKTIMEKNSNHKKHQFKSIKEKFEILDYYHEVDANGNLKHIKADILTYFKIELKTFNLWLKNEQKLRDESNKNKKNINSGRNTSFSEYEQSKILEIVKDTLKEKIAITYKDFVNIYI